MSLNLKGPPMRNSTPHTTVPFVSAARRSAEPLPDRHDVQEPPKPGLQAIAWRRALKVVVGRIH
jgi:hypothetical protein